MKATIWGAPNAGPSHVDDGCLVVDGPPIGLEEFEPSLAGLRWAVASLLHKNVPAFEDGYYHARVDAEAWEALQGEDGSEFRRLFVGNPHHEIPDHIHDRANVVAFALGTAIYLDRA